MTKIIDIKSFRFEISPTDIVIKKDGSIMIHPAEGFSLENAITTAAAFQSSELKPAYLSVFPFKLFLEEDGFYIARQDNENDRLKVEWHLMDELIMSTRDAVEIVKDERRLRPGIRSGGWSPPNKGVVIG